MRFSNDNELYHIIGLNIKFYRNQLNMTQTQLADSAQISISYLSKIESKKCNKSISLSTLNQIANTLDVEITEFFKER